VYNRYLSAISYEPGVLKVITAGGLRAAAGFQAYEMEDDNSNDLAEFALANAIYTALVEGHAAEISARRTAMENASNVSVPSTSPVRIGWKISGCGVNGRYQEINEGGR